jgi:hypothetical protein
MTDEELQEMIDEADRDGDGEIDESEFLRIMVRDTFIFMCIVCVALTYSIPFFHSFTQKKTSLY